MIVQLIASARERAFITCQSKTVRIGEKETDDAVLLRRSLCATQNFAHLQGKSMMKKLFARVPK